MDCGICCEAFNKNTRREVDCSKCGCKTCIGCVKKYLAQSLGDPHCMSCKHPWDTYFLNSVLPRNYMTAEWRALRGQVLYEREKSFFPETIPLVDREIRLEKMREEYIALYRQEQEIRKKRMALNDEISNLLYNKKEENADEGYKRKCPAPECKGYIDGNGHCILCGSDTCMKCNVVIPPASAHACDENDVDTWKFVQKNSKPCPNCGTRIQRSEGCAQMWCPGCHKAFNWNTGKIEKGPVHNPHYYEYIANLNGNAPPLPVYDPCANVWDFFYFHNLALSAKNEKDFRFRHQRLNHIVQVDLVKNQRLLEKGNLDLRIGFLRDKISEKEYKRQLIRRETQNQKLRRIVDIQETIRLVATPLLSQLAERQITYDQFKESIGMLLKMANESIDKINTNFRSDIGSFSF